MKKEINEWENLVEDDDVPTYANNRWYNVLKLIQYKAGQIIDVCLMNKLKVNKCTGHIRLKDAAEVTITVFVANELHTKSFDVKTSKTEPITEFSFDSFGLELKDFNLIQLTAKQDVNFEFGVYEKKK